MRRFAIPLVLLSAGLLSAASNDVKGIDIVINQKPSGIMVTTATDSSGAFRVLGLPPGEYTIEARPRCCSGSPSTPFLSAFHVVKSAIKNNDVTNGIPSAARRTILVSRPDALISGPNVTNDAIQDAGLLNQALLFRESFTLTGTADITGVIISEDVNLSTTSLRFIAAEGGTAPPVQTLQITSASANQVTYAAAFTADPRTPSWNASLSRAGNTLTAGTGDEILVQPQSAGLAPGNYAGQIKISVRDGSRAFDRVAAVTLTVLARANSAVLPIAVDRKMDFSPLRDDGVTYTPSTFHVTNTSEAAQSYTVTPLKSDQGNTILISPSTFTLLPGAVQAVQIQSRKTPNAPPVTFLTATAKDCVTVSRTEKDGTISTFTYYKLPADTTSTLSVGGNNTCHPTRLIPVFAELDATAASGHALNGKLQVWDDCGLERRDYSAQITESDPVAATVQSDIAYSPAGKTINTAGAGAIAAFSVRHGDWDPARKALTLAAAVHLTDPLTGMELTGTTSLSVPIDDTTPRPYLSPSGTISAASFNSVGVAPGEIISAFGVFPNAPLAVADKVPLPEELSGLALELDGQPMPLFFASVGQINAVVPFGTTPGLHSLVLKSGPPDYTSAPLEINVVAANPAFWVTDGSGGGQAHVYKIAANGAQILVDQDHAAQEGDTLVMYVSGLGDVQANVTRATLPRSRFCRPLRR